MREPAFTPTQSAFLDLLRYALASVVVIGHGLGFFLGYFEGFFPRVFPYIQSIAVVCFFYLSGFLIVGSQLRHAAEGRSTLRQYLFDRASRVYVTLLPSLVFVLIADHLFTLVAPTSSEMRPSESGAIVFLKNVLLVPSVPFGSMRPIWSLMYEWWIYLLFGGLFFLRSNAVVAGFLTVVGLVLVGALGMRSEAGHIWVIWALGGLMAHFHGRCLPAARRSLTPAALAGVFILGAGWIYTVKLDAYNLAAGILLCLALFSMTLWSSRPTAGWLVSVAPMVKRMAGFSFTLFLTHYTVLIHTRAFLDGWVGLLVGFALSNVVALGIASVTEFKLSSLKRWMRRRARQWRSDESLA